MTQHKVLTIRIVTPEKAVFTHQASMVVMPGAEGEFGILPLHIPLITMLKEGILKLYQQSTITSEIMVSQGYGQVFNDEVLILTDFAIDLAELTIEQVGSNIESLQEKLDKSTSAENKSSILKDLSRNKMILAYKENKKRSR
ncbi:MAG: atpC [Rickettsiaceae bacterium]|jgi:F-type H+-transporting ATPase subunit epsilon|nr:atpC [Rickettsiaceae bacterium]